ncbi:anhydro-N-acetylmuramic acid kinase [Leptolyngbya boryana CZ1]|uniref:Anhydro-N-acetylmuramic acid kinase n=1 Tax=Leptolyngbya boryana CZ1 TaxID=3060204 RepID=A0AA96WU41_LEPBY|nr:anhydro-N-acetylmuramic acid kinase [Leptolyngbya boryana]WNZ45681.1 anhydro-N-acetylmuramic acid kinase [Leptolyngbya boryana CZ1]
MRVIGLMSGTSVDGIDAALVDISGSTEDLQAMLIAGATYPYPAELRDRILAVCGGAPLSLAELAELDDAIATQFAQAALKIQANQAPAVLIGSHGQTVFHRPLNAQLGYSLQIGRGEVIAHQTKIATVSNFRAADIAIGGQGAPLVPPIDAALLRHPIEHRCVQNIGGIGNVTYLPPLKADLPIRGWDTGAGNMLIDLAVQRFSEQTYDRDGAWAARGTPNLELVDRWLQQDFFQQPPPKSTGREHFGAAYLDACLTDASGLTQADILATLTEFTAASIAQSYQRFLPQLPDRVLVCGGGSRNTYLKQRLQFLLPDSIICTTDDLGLNADFKEAIAFAVLAYWRYHEIPGNLPEVTGAPKSVLLGEIHHVV